MDTIKDIECMDEKGNIKFIPEHLTKNYSFMTRNKLAVRQIPQMEPIIDNLLDIDFDEVNTEINEDFAPEEIKDELPNDREELFKLLDEKGVVYKKTYGVPKLKQLLIQ